MAELIIDKEKITCSKCGEQYPATEEFFYKQLVRSKTKGDFYRLAAPCKKCRKKDALDYVMTHREQNEINRAKYRKTQKYRDRVKETQEKLQDYYKQWRKDNPEYFREMSRRWQSNKKHEISQEELNVLYEYCDSSCMYCGMTEEDHKKIHNQRLHRDHAINEGSNGIDNCVMACKSCNVSKWDRDWDEWYNPDNPKYDEDRYEKIKEWIDSFK